MAAVKDMNFEPKGPDAHSATSNNSVAVAQGDVVSEDPAIRDFYSDAVSEAYRMKSELVSQHLADIGMGRYVRRQVD